MTKKYTREQIDKARQLADFQYDQCKDIDGVDAPGLWIEAFAHALGLEVGPEKPAPGVYLTNHGDVLIVSYDRFQAYPDTLWMVGDGGGRRVRNVNVGEPNNMHPLTPARVVSADEWGRTLHDLEDSRAKEQGLVTELADADDRIQAWEEVASHPFFKPCYEAEDTLLSAMLAKLDGAKEQGEPVELSETEVGELWDGRRLKVGRWNDLSTAKRVDVTATVNAAIRKFAAGDFQ